MVTYSHEIVTPGDAVRGLVQSQRITVERAERELLETVWAEVEPALFRLALALGLNGPESEDMLQDVYLTALQKMPSGLDRTGLRRWLYRVATNRCQLEHRRNRGWRAAVRAVFQFSRTAITSAPHVSQAEEQRELVRRGLNDLDPQLKTVLVLRYYAQFNSREIGRILQLADSTVRSRLRTARIKLARLLKEKGYEDD